MLSTQAGSPLYFGMVSVGFTKTIFVSAITALMVITSVRLAGIVIDLLLVSAASMLAPLFLHEKFTHFESIDLGNQSCSPNFSGLYLWF